MIYIIETEDESIPRAVLEGPYSPTKVYQDFRTELNHQFWDEDGIEVGDDIDPEFYQNKIDQRFEEVECWNLLDYWLQTQTIFKMHSYIYETLEEYYGSY